MSVISASSLFHFTTDLCAIKGILENGFRFSYCFESFPKAVNFNKLHPQNAMWFYSSDSVNNGILIPMICFCDTPLLRTIDHADTYGKYLIGIDKEFAMSAYRNLLNPVTYVTSQMVGLAISDLSVILSQENKIIGAYDIIRSIHELIGRIKPYRGEFRGETHCFADEREWRILIPYKNEENIQWIPNVCPDEEIRKKYNNMLYEAENVYIKFVDELCEDDFLKFVTHIMVNNEDEIPELVDFILNKDQQIFGYTTLSPNARNILVSKISSFERLRKDY